MSLSSLSSQPVRGGWSTQLRQPGRALLHRAPCRRAAGGARLRTPVSCSAVDVERAKVMIERDGYKVVDVRPAAEYEGSRITKPARCSTNVPFAPNLVAAVGAAFPSPAAKLIVMCANGGMESQQAVDMLLAAGYQATLQMEGGYAGWREIWSPSGKRRPPPGKWVSTGKEALKSGLNIPGVAESYDEGGNLVQARYAKGLDDGEQLPP